MKLQRPIVCALLFLACVGVSSTVCLANDGTSITINGVSPRNGIGSSLYTATSKDGDVTSCTWSITNPIKDDQTFTGTLAECENHGKDCYLTFHSFGTVTLNCSATVDVKGTTKIQSGSREIQCHALPPNTQPTLEIVGEDIVSQYSEQKYVAKYSAPKGVPQITWTYPGITAHNGRDITLTFDNLGTFRLDCVLRCTDEQGNNLDPVPDHKDIKVLPPVNLTALRANYENSNVANIPGEGIVKIHYNIDDDDESYVATDQNMGADCLQTAFKQNNTNPDDDLCKPEISLGNAIDIDELTEGTVYIEITKGLRLWRNNMRTKDEDIFLGKIKNNGQKELSIALSLAIPGEKDKIRDILDPNKGLYVEGEAPGYGYIKIRFADKKLKLPYWAYAVGGPADQPDLVTRRKYKNKFKTIGQKKGLVDCEWCVVGFDQETRWDKFNCIAYAIDPNRTVFNSNNLINPFNGAFWVNPKLNPAIGFDNQNNLNNINEPFLLYLKILKNLWNGIDDSVLQDALEDQFYKEPDGDYYKIGGYNDLFKQAVEQLIEDVGRQNLVFETYLTTMNLFNPSDKNNFNLQDVKCFFTSPRWAPANDGQALTECNSENDNARKIVYYENFHAARVLSHSPVPQKLGDNKDPSWKIMVSKDDASPELLIHLEEQISSVYGDVKKAYK